jgi:hypothetical protein
VDNEDTSSYSEFGEWFTSNAQAWGQSSRYAFLNNGASASFEVVLPEEGVYDVFEIVPTTVNAADHALYVLSIGNTVVDSTVLDQNQLSGNWVFISRSYLPADVPIMMQVIDDGDSSPNAVLRADALKFQLVDLTVETVEDPELTRPAGFALTSNFPNPFNPETNIRYALPEQSDVLISIYDMGGRMVFQQHVTAQAPGWHQFTWRSMDSRNNPVSTGVYFCRVQSENGAATIKMVHLK